MRDPDLTARRSGGCGAARRLRALAPETAPLTLAEPAPDPELLAVHQRELEALETHDAAPAHLFRLAGARPALGKEQIGIDAEAVRLVLPASVIFGGVLQCHRCGLLPHQAVMRRTTGQRNDRTLVITSMSLSPITSRIRKRGFRICEISRQPARRPLPLAILRLFSMKSTST